MSKFLLKLILFCRSAKTAITEGIEVPIEEGLAIEKKCYADVIHTQDRIEGLSAFAAKRAPVYRGCWLNKTKFIKKTQIRKNFEIQLIFEHYITD